MIEGAGERYWKDLLLDEGCVLSGDLPSRSAGEMPNGRPAPQRRRRILRWWFRHCSCAKSQRQLACSCAGRFAIGSASETQALLDDLAGKLCTLSHASLADQTIGASISARLGATGPITRNCASSPSKREEPRATLRPARRRSDLAELKHRLPEAGVGNPLFLEESVAHAGGR